jgi:hypothetical protein
VGALNVLDQTSRSTTRTIGVGGRVPATEIAAFRERHREASTPRIAASVTAPVGARFTLPAGRRAPPRWVAVGAPGGFKDGPQPLKIIEVFSAHDARPQHWRKKHCRWLDRPACLK